MELACYVPGITSLQSGEIEMCDSFSLRGRLNIRDSMVWAAATAQSCTLRW